MKRNPTTLRLLHPDFSPPSHSLLFDFCHSSFLLLIFATNHLYLCSLVCLPSAVPRSQSPQPPSISTSRLSLSAVWLVFRWPSTWVFRLSVLLVSRSINQFYTSLLALELEPLNFMVLHGSCLNDCRHFGILVGCIC
ncbi:hypothetical protein ACOSP7_026428 [Xanthoceras sorbifolium]